MSSRKNRDVAKMLGGLGAMYAISQLPVGEGVRPEDVNQEDAAKYRRELEERIARARAGSSAASQLATDEPVRHRVVIPKDLSELIGRDDPELFGRKKGGSVKSKKMASGGMTSASKRADGIATKGKTKCKMY